MQNTSSTPSSSTHTGKVMTFARRHPVLTIAGVGGAGLLGGAELAGGILIGAGVTSLLRPKRTREPGEPTQPLSEKPRALVERIPREVRQRARAVYDAARGKYSAPPPQPSPAEQQPTEEQPLARADQDQPVETWTP